MKKTIYIYGILILLVVLISINIEFLPTDLLKGLPKLYLLFSEAIPPDVSVLKIAFPALLETLQIAFLGTFFGLIIVFPLSILGSRNLFSKYIVIPIRILLASVRTMPSLLWAIIFVIIIGFGPTAGILATAMYTIGYLGKLQYESIEGLENESLQAISSTGANKLQLIRFVILPELANNFLSQILFMFEYNFRASSILGFVGAGGIGFYIHGYLQFMQYDKVIMLLIIVLITVLVIDYISNKIRDQYLSSTIFNY